MRTLQGAAAVLAVMLSGLAQAQGELCREISLPTDDIVTECVTRVDCMDPNTTGAADLVCETICGSEAAIGDPMCAGRLICGPGQVKEDGQCIPNVQAGLCTPRDVSEFAARISIKLENNVSDRSNLVIALAVVRQNQFQLPNGQSFRASPLDDSAESRMMRRSIERFSRRNGTPCTVTESPLEAGTCNRPFTDAIAKLEPAIQGEFEQLNDIFDQQIKANDNFDSCVFSGNRGSRELVEALNRTAEADREIGVFIGVETAILSGRDDFIRIVCQRPDIRTCGVSLRRALPVPVTPPDLSDPESGFAGL